MGQKVHPVGFRVGVIREWDSKWYMPDRGFADALYEDYGIRRYVKGTLRSAAISRIEIERAGTRLRVTLHTAKPGIIIGRGGKGVDDLKASLERMTKKQVHVNVQEIRYPDRDAQLVAESIAQQIEKRIAYKRAMRQAIMRAMKLGVRGIRVICSGRLAGAEMARREKDRQGKIPLHTLRADIDYGFTEAATTYGNIGIKVWIYKGDVLPGQTRQAEPDLPRLSRANGRPDRSGERAERVSRGVRTTRVAGPYDVAPGDARPRAATDSAPAGGSQPGHAEAPPERQDAGTEPETAPAAPAVEEAQAEDVDMDTALAQFEALEGERGTSEATAAADRPVDSDEDR